MYVVLYFFLPLRRKNEQTRRRPSFLEQQVLVAGISVGTGSLERRAAYVTDVPRTDHPALAPGALVHPYRDRGHFLGYESASYALEEKENSMSVGFCVRSDRE